VTHLCGLGPGGAPTRFFSVIQGPFRYTVFMYFSKSW